jgi:hypothetical protein
MLTTVPLSGCPGAVRDVLSIPRTGNVLQQSEVPCNSIILASESVAPNLEACYGLRCCFSNVLQALTRSLIFLACNEKSGYQTLVRSSHPFQNKRATTLLSDSQACPLRPPCSRSCLSRRIHHEERMTTTAVCHMRKASSECYSQA